MKMSARNLISAVSFLVLFWTIACNVQAKEQNVLVGSIPGDAAAKQMLAIDASEKIDFIRMRIALNEGGRLFDLKAAYGIGKPNTRDFENGGKSLTVKGTLEIKEKDGYLIYRLFNDETRVDISLIRLNDQMFHVLSSNGKLLSGNGGWNYTLSRETETKTKLDAPLSSKKTEITHEPETVVFGGRTPCVEIAREQRIAVAEDCFKLKWKLTLNRDASSGSPTTFTLQRTFRRPEPLEGKWRILKDSGALIYRLEANDGTTMSFQRIDDSLFFLDNGGRMLKGNGEFGYTLDRQRVERSAEMQKAKME